MKRDTENLATKFSNDRGSNLLVSSIFVTANVSTSALDPIIHQAQPPNTYFLSISILLTLKSLKSLLSMLLCPISVGLVDVAQPHFSKLSAHLRLHFPLTSSALLLHPHNSAQGQGHLQIPDKEETTFLKDTNEMSGFDPGAMPNFFFLRFLITIVHYRLLFLKQIPSSLLFFLKFLQLFF